MNQHTSSERPAVNVGQNERLASVAGGIALAGWGIYRRSGITPFLLFLGGALIRRGFTGHCELKEKLGLAELPTAEESGVPGEQGFHLMKSVDISGRSPAQVFQYWRNFENLPVFMPHLQAVTVTGDRTSHWVVEGPAGTSVEWDAEIINEHPDEMIAWQTLPGAQVKSAGSVRFHPIDDGSGTRVTVNLEFDPPAGKLGAVVARIFGESPGQQLDEDLSRFRQLVESETACPTV